MRRDWRDANRKREEESVYGCRVCGRQDQGALALAHIIDRANDERSGGRTPVWVNPDLVVLLCPPCHTAYDEHRLDLYPHLDAPERQAAVDRLGYGQAMRRLRGRRWLHGP